MNERAFPAFWQSARTFLRNLWRVARQVFHETTGTFFALFALYGALAAWRQWRYRPTPWVIAFAAIYALMMAVFAWGAFRRARRVR